MVSIALQPNVLLGVGVLCATWGLSPLPVLFVAAQQGDGTRIAESPDSACRCEGEHVCGRVGTIFEQPEVERDAVSDRVIGEVRPRSEWFCVRVANVGVDTRTSVIPWDVGRYTGFDPADRDQRALYQRGPSGDTQGTAVQLRGTEIGIWIDSDHPRPRHGFLIPVCPGYWWWDVTKAPRPFQSPDQELSFSMEMKVPTAERQGAAEVYVCAYLLLRDARSGRQFWLGPSLFDLRSVEQFPDTVHFDGWEGGTKLPILFAALSDRNAWFRPGPASAVFTDRPFDVYRRFDFRVGQSELRAAVTALKERWPELDAMSLDPAEYQLTHFNVNPEVYAPDGSRGRLGLAIRNIRLDVLQRTE
jgi:hypothetical protein